MLAGCPSQSTDTKAPQPVTHSARFGGVVYGGQQAIVGSAVLVIASGTSAGALPSVIGSAVTNSSGNFGPITLSPAPASGQVIYVVAVGGDAGAGNNSAIKLLSVVGIGGSTLAPIPATVNVNELTTVASTAALKDYLDFAACSSFSNPDTWPLNGVTT